MSFSCNWDNHSKLIFFAVYMYPYLVFGACALCNHTIIVIILLPITRSILTLTNLPKLSFTLSGLQLHKHSENTNYEITVNLAILFRMSYFLSCTVMETCGSQQL